jgi:guanylate kinase
MEEIKIKRKGFMFVLSSPSGAGKTTLARALLISNNDLVMSVSVTTRRKRPEEQDGVDYHFISKDQYDEMVRNDQLLEHAQVFDEYYGTPRNKVSESLEQGKDILFDIDWQGTSQLASKAPEDLVSLFILPPSMKELSERLKRRAQDSEEVVLKRMSKANVEISHWDSYDYVIINHDIADSLKKITSILVAERLKRLRRQGLKDFVDVLLKN